MGGIEASGKANYSRKINDAYSESFADRYLKDINLSLNQIEKIKYYLKSQKIKGAFIGISFIYENFEVINIEERGYYSFYFYTDESSKYNHGIVLEINNQKIDENIPHIFQLKNSNGFITFYGLDYDQYLFQRASIGLVETNSNIYEKKEITLDYILNHLEQNDENLKNDDLINKSKYFCYSICKLLKLSIDNIFNVIPDKNMPKGRDILSRKILNALN